MSCRCHDISDCGHDITNLNKGNGYAKELIDSDSTVEDKLTTLSGLYTTTFTVTNIRELVNKNNLLNDRLKALFAQLNTRITAEIEKLTQELKDMKSEDKQYHEAQRNHH